MWVENFRGCFHGFTRRYFLSIAGVWLLAGAPASDDEAVWSQYLSWLKGRVVDDTLGLESYRKALIEQGLAKAEVDRSMRIISERAFRRPEAMRLWFNSMYGPEGPVGPDWPTPFVVEVAKDLTPGTALDVCMGEGRNSIFLASRGWKLTGFDVSDVAVMNARRKADKAGVKLTAIRSGYQEFDFGDGKWDLIVMTYAYFPIREAVYVNRLVRSMRPGSLLAFQHGVLEKGEDRSGTAPLLGIPEEGELKEVFRSLAIVRYEEVEEESDWQVSHGHRMGRTVRMLAKKPRAKQF